MTPPCHRTHPLVRAHPDSTHTAPPPSLSPSPSAQTRPCKGMPQSVSCSPGPRSARRPPPADTSTPHADVVKARSHRRPGEMPPEQSTTRACDQATCARGPLAVSRRPRLSCARPQPPTRISDPAGCDARTARVAQRPRRCMEEQVQRPYRVWAGVDAHTARRPAAG